MRALTPGATVSAREVVTALDLRRPRGDRPRVVGVMIASADGRASVAGRSVALGHPEDRALLRELRTASDAVLVGSATLRAERYGRLLDADQVAWRGQLGLSQHPVIATISRDGSLAAGDAPVLSEAGVPVVVYTSAAAEGLLDGSASAGRSCVQQVRPPGANGSFLAGVLSSLRDDHGVRGVACEGGPTLLRALLAEGLLDDLLLTVAPALVGGPGPAIIAGEPLPAAIGLHLATIHRADDHVFLHYAVDPPR